MTYEDMSPELRDKARECKTPEELLNLAKKEGYKLSEEELRSVTGGDNTWDNCDSPYVCESDGGCHGKIR